MQTCPNAVLVGINGLKGSGKDFFAKQLRDKLESQGYRVGVRKFADPIKFSLEDMFGRMTEEQYDMFKRTAHPIGFGDEARLVWGRDIVRGHGMKMRSYDGGQQFLDYVTAPIESCDVILVTDLRFDNEFDQIAWATKIKVVGEGVVSDGHESEQVRPDDQFEFAIFNDMKNPFDDYFINAVYKDVVTKFECGCAGDLPWMD